MASKKHAELIRAWLDGAKIELWHNNSKTWRPVADPLFDEDREYRIKPAEPEREDRVLISMPAHEIQTLWNRSKANAIEFGEKYACRTLINDGLRYACDNGQIVTRAEFDRAIGDRAARDLALAQACSDRVSKALTSHETMPISVKEFLDIIREVK